MLSPTSLRVNALNSVPLSMSDARLYLRTDGTDEDVIITQLLKDAVSWAEGFTHRTFFSRSHRWVLRDFPRGRNPAIKLPRGKTTSVASIAYHDNNDTIITLTGPTSGSPAGTDWREDLGGDDGATLYPPYGENWPDVDDDHPAPVVITFTAGWAAAELPSDLVRAIWQTVSDSYDARHAAVMPPTLFEIWQQRFSAWCLPRQYL